MNLGEGILPDWRVSLLCNFALLGQEIKKSAHSGRQRGTLTYMNGMKLLPVPRIILVEHRHQSAGPQIIAYREVGEAGNSISSEYQLAQRLAVIGLDTGGDWGKIVAPADINGQPSIERV